jgi:membrane-bound serine protease (ClpP class)
MDVQLIRIREGAITTALALSAGRLRLLGVVGLVVAAIGAAELAVAAEADEPKAVLLRIEGVITPLTQNYASSRLETARAMGAGLVIIEIESPGGMLEPSLAIADMLVELKWARTVAYIRHEALSGAAFVALGCESIYVRPNARLGDAGPIVLGEDAMFRHAPEKVVSDLAVRMQQLAKARNRSAPLLEAMVDKDLEVLRVRHQRTGRESFMTERDLTDPENRADWQPVRVVTQKGRFLEVSGDQAVEFGLADGAVDGFAQLKDRLGLSREPHALLPSAVDTILWILNLPIVAGLLLVVGLICLYFEIQTAGFGLAGLASGLCFLLFFWSRFLGGTAGWLEVLLFLAGLACLALEVFVLPGFGVTGVAGIVLILTSIVLASQTFVIPTTRAEYAKMGESLAVLGAALIVFIGSAVMLSRHLESIPLVRRLMLTPPDHATAADLMGAATLAATGTSLEGVVRPNDLGKAVTPLRPAGKAVFGSRYVDVVAEGAFVPPGSKVRVIAVVGNRVVVRGTDGEFSSTA